MRCYSCDKEMWPEEYDGIIVFVDGDPRCAECKAQDRIWLGKYKTKQQ